jgi:hypothetical protein
MCLIEDGKKVTILCFRRHSYFVRYDSFVANYTRQELRTLARIITGLMIIALAPLVFHDNVQDVPLSLIMNFELPLAREPTSLGAMGLGASRLGSSVTCEP